MTQPTIETVLWDDWHVVGEYDAVIRARRLSTRLLGVPVLLETDAAGRIAAHANAERIASVETRYGFVWVCLGTPTRGIVDFPECADTDRWVASAGSVRVAVSGLRAVENFLDLSHLAFVHAGYLGEQPHTEITQYTVQTTAEDGVLATGCRVYQPKASPVACDGYDVDYVYAVLRPYIVVLYKANPVEIHRKDMIALFVQPVSEESCVAHMLTCYLKHDVEPAAVRRFQQFIFGQDRPILENQIPKRLPLAPRVEIAIRADASSAAYRRWLSERGVRFGAIPAM